MTAIVVKTDRTFKVKEFSEPLYKSIGKAVGGHIEVIYPQLLTAPFLVVVNDCGLPLHLPINEFGCFLYRTITLGSPIVGDIVIAKEIWTDDGPGIGGLTDEEILSFRDALNTFNYKETANDS